MGFSLVVAKGSYSLVAVHGLLIAVASLVAEDRLLGMQASVVSARGLSCCGSGALEHRLNSCDTISVGHVGPSGIGDQTCISCIGRQILYH